MYNKGGGASEHVQKALEWQSTGDTQYLQSQSFPSALNTGTLFYGCDSDAHPVGEHGTEAVLMAMAWIIFFVFALQHMWS